MSLINTEIERGKELHLLANKYFYGSDTVERDYKKARETYLEALKLGNIESYAKLGVIYINAEGVDENKARGFYYLSTGADLGDINCYAELAIGYYNNDNIIESVASWSDYFNLSDKYDLSIYYSYMYLKMVSKDTVVRLRYETKLSYVKIELIEFVESLKRDSSAEGLLTDEDDILISFINNNIEDIKDEDDIYLEFLRLKYGSEKLAPNYEMALAHFNKHFAPDFSSTENTQYFYYRNEEKPIDMYFNFLEQGIEKGDYNCIGAKASSMFEVEDYSSGLKLWDLYFYRADGDINPVFALEYINYISVYGFKVKHLQALKDIKQIIVKTIKEYEERNGKDDSFVKTSNKFIERELSGKSWWQKVFN